MNDLLLVPTESVLVSVPIKTKTFLENLSENGISYTIISPSLRHLIDRQKAKSLYRGISSGVDNYLNFEQIEVFMHEVHRKYKDRVTLYKIGKTVEKRKILAVKITETGVKSKSSVKKKVLIHCGIHAREWISIAICMNLINNFVSKENPIYLNLIKKFDFYLIPVLNPDGYAYVSS